MATSSSTTASAASSHLAANVKGLREARGRSQAQLAKVAGIPRPTWATLERGDGNPTLHVLLKVATALGVSVEELVAPPRTDVCLVKRDDLPQKRRGQVTVSDLLPEPVPGLQMERLLLEPGGSMTGQPHTAGTREYLCCHKGKVVLTAAGESWVLSEGDVLMFRGDQKHSYRNPGRSAAVAFSVVALAAG